MLGGYVVRDPRLTGLTGRYLYGDLCRSDLRTLNLGVPGADPQPAGISIPSGDLRGFGEDSRGCVYVETSANVYRVAALPDAGAACPLPSANPPGAGAGAGGRLGVGLARKKRQRLRRYVTFTVTCSETCALSANGALRIYKGRRHPRSAPPTTVAPAAPVTSSERVCPRASPALRSSSI